MRAAKQVPLGYTLAWQSVSKTHLHTRQLAHLVAAADGGQIVDEQNVLYALVPGQLGDAAAVIPVVHHIHRLVVIHQERHKGVAEGFLHHDAALAVADLRVLNHREGIVAHDERTVLQAGRGGGLVKDDLTAGEGAVLVVAVLHGGGGADGMVGVHRVRIVLHGIRLAAVVVERAEEARKLAHLIVAEVVGRDALGRAELHIGVIRAQRRPVVVGAEIDVLRPVGHHHVVQGDRFYILPHSR